MTPLSTLIEQQPLFAVCITVAAYAASEVLWRKTGRSALLNPVLTATAAVAALLLMLGISYDDYIHRAEPINETLPLLIVLLAVPLCRQFALIRTAGFPMSLALMIGSVVAIASALALPVAMEASDSLLATIAPKSVTTAVAIEIADRLGGVTGVTAVIVISCGIFGAVFGPLLLEAAGVRDDAAKGFALGVASSALGTARAFQISETAGAFASIGMILNAVLTIFLVPAVIAQL
ncbi:LrgB family protein [Aestuariicoccus sp. MJ-SS9]|uniref:LrgB family protein n=1 Tax=Aestuariicoccus sp. MJ-SS9 TaxID=3079855 RepID=UPI00290A0A3C|nr:LrgB family protein [Aestuariicoccus sp. MJ-SS9]MDU8914021.1 LrgB family protein [Aestuariicoccus sp. MJ-SS9]